MIKKQKEVPKFLKHIKHIRQIIIFQKIKHLVNIRVWKLRIIQKFGLHRYLSHRGTILQHIAQDLLSLVFKSEQRSLFSGEKLQEFSSTSNEICTQTKIFLQKLDDTGDENVLNNIRHLLQEIAPILFIQNGAMTALCEYLEPMSEKLYQLSNLQYDFQKISRFLKILGTSIKIESNRTGQEGFKFLHLADEIDRIWTHITQNTENLFCQVAGSADLVNLIKGRIAGKCKHYQALISNIQESILSIMNEVDESFRLFSKALNTIDDNACYISKEIEKISCSIQLNDIIKQQLEHAHMVIDGIGGQLKNSNSLKAAQFPTLFQETNKTLSEQMAKLKKMAPEMDQAGKHLREKLIEIAGKPERENEAISVLKENTPKIEKPDQLENEIARLASILHQGQDLDQEISQALVPVTRSAIQTEEYMNEMEKVGYNFNILALNAVIKATNNFESGKNFAALAEEIRRQAKLSGELCRKACLESSTLVNNNKALENILGLMGEEKGKVISIVSQTFQNITGLRSLNRESIRTIHLLREQNTRLASEFMATTQDIQADNFFQTKLSQSLKELEAIQNELQAFFQAAPKSKRKAQDTGMESLLKCGWQSHQECKGKRELDCETDKTSCDIREQL